MRATGYSFGQGGSRRPGPHLAYTAQTGSEAVVILEVSSISIVSNMCSHYAPSRAYAHTTTSERRSQILRSLNTIRRWLLK